MVDFSAKRFSPKRISPSNIKAKIEPHMHLQVPMEKGVYKDARWSNPDLDPITPENRTWGALVRYLTRKPVDDADRPSRTIGLTGPVIC
jgi:hypothetical protein